MKRLFTLGFLIIQFCFCLSAITLTDMTTLCDKKNWNETDIFLKQRSWQYYSSTDSSMVYQKLTDIYSPEEYISVFFDNNNVSSVTALTSSQESYMRMCDQLKKSGFTVYSDNIDATEQTIWYRKKGYKFSITQIDNEGTTVYRFSIAKPYTGTKMVQINKTNFRIYNYVDDRLHGLQKFYYKDKLIIECNYIDNQASGDCTFFLYSDDKYFNDNWYVKFEGKISQNQQIGKWTTYINEHDTDRNIGYYNWGNGKEMTNPCAFWKDSTYIVTSISGNKVLQKYYKLINTEGNEYASALNLIGVFDFNDPDFISGLIANEPIIELWSRFMMSVGSIPRLATSNILELKLHGEATFIDNVENGTRKYYENGLLSCAVNIVDGKENGSFTAYYTDDASMSGRVRTIGNFKNGNKDGIETAYDTKGEIIAKTSFLDGKKEGEDILYYTSDPHYEDKLFYRKNVKPNSICKHRFYHKDELEGKSVMYDMYGEATIIENYHNNVLHGPVKLYYTRDTVYFPDDYISDNPRSNLLLSTEYVNGSEEGEYAVYDRNSQVTSNGHLKNGENDGTWYRYYTSDSLYNRKELINPSQSKFMYSKENYKNGSLHGESTKYFNRVPVQIDEYENGKKIKCTLFKDGEVCEIIDKSKLKQIQVIRDTTIEVTREVSMNDELFSKPQTAKVPILTIDNLYSFKEKELLARQYEVKIGGVTVTKTDWLDVWKVIFYDRSQNLVISFPQKNIASHKIDFSSVTFQYMFNESLFSGTYNIIDKTSNIKSELKIKKGFVETAKISDLKSGETIEKQKYKDGILVE